MLNKYLQRNKNKIIFLMHCQKFAKGSVEKEQGFRQYTSSIF